MFMKAKGTATKVVNLHNQFGVSMSYRWTTDALRFYSVEELLAFFERVEAGIHHCFLYDNIRIVFRKETQRVNNQTHGNNGTSITAIQTMDINIQNIFKTYGPAYKESQLRLNNLTPPPELNLQHLMKIEHAQLLRSWHLYLIMDLLLSLPEFTEYEYRNDPLFSVPALVHRLPIKRTPYSMLKTLPIEEASYERNLQVLDVCVVKNFLRWAGELAFSGETIMTL